MEVVRGATRWKFFLYTSRSFLNQNVRDQTAGKPTFRGQTFRVNPKQFNEYFPKQLGCNHWAFSFEFCQQSTFKINVVNMCNDKHSLAKLSFFAIMIIDLRIKTGVYEAMTTRRRGDGEEVTKRQRGSDNEATTPRCGAD